MAKPDYSQPDHYAKKAKDQGYAARSVFKLEEVAEKERLFRPGQFVLDLGAAPGSWMQYAATQVGPAGRVVGLDLTPLGRQLRPNERFLKANALAVHPDQLLPGGQGFDLVLSDMMPNTSGNKDSDHYRSVELARRALALADALLKPGGHFLVKVFQGPDFEAYRAELRDRFQSVKIKKPKSSRPNSREVYLLGLSKIRKQGGR